MDENQSSRGCLTDATMQTRAATTTASGCCLCRVPSDAEGEGAADSDMAAVGH